MPRPHQHNDIELNFVTRGAIRYLFGNCELSVPAGFFALFWAAMPHYITGIAPNTAHYYVHLPTAWFLQWQLPFTQDILKGRSLVIRAHSPRDPIRFYDAFFERLSNETVSGDPQQKTIALLEIEACARRLAAQYQADARDYASMVRQKTGKAAHMVQHITAHYADPNLDIAAVAAAVQLKPNSAMKLFRRHYATTILNYLTHYRVAQAQHLLMTTQADIIDIAYEVGFSSVSRFYAAFKQITGGAPGAYRKTMENLRFDATPVLG